MAQGKSRLQYAKRCALAIVVMVFSIYGLYAVHLVANHLHEHGLRMGELAEVLYEARHPSGVNILLLFSGTLVATCNFLGAFFMAILVVADIFTGKKR